MTVRCPHYRVAGPTTYLGPGFRSPRRSPTTKRDMCILLTVATYQTSRLLGRKKELDGLSIGNPQGLAQGADRLSENFIGFFRWRRYMCRGRDFRHARASRSIHVLQDLENDAVGQIDVTPDRRLKLLDFGLAVALEKGEQATDVYELTGETGSRRYMAPEVCLSQPYGVAVDVYSWAVVAFEIWSLRGKPFSTYSLETHAEKVVVAGERPSMPPTWSSDVKELLTCAWRGAVWESTSTPSRSRGQHRVDGVGRPN